MVNNKPEISKINEFRYDSSVQIFGEEFEQGCSVYFWTPKNEINNIIFFDEPPMLPPEDARVFKPDNIINQAIYIAANENIQSGVQVVWVKNDIGFSKPYVANLPQVWNQSLTKATAGDIFALYGDCLGKNLHGKYCLLINKSTQKSYMLKNLGEADVQTWTRENHAVEFKITEEIPVGDYQVYLNTGSGGNLGWSEPVELTIYNGKSTATEYFRMQWNDTADRQRILDEDIEVITVKPSEKLFFDMADTIQQAINSLEKGGIVRLTKGIYEISHTVNLKDGVVLFGEGENLTKIKASTTKGMRQDWSNIEYARLEDGGKGFAEDWLPCHEQYTRCALIKLTNDSGVQNIGFELGNGANIGLLLANDSQEPICGAFVNHCTINSLYHDVYEPENGFGAVCTGILSVCNNNDLVIYDNKIYALMPITILPARNNRMKLIRNHIESIPAQTNEALFCGTYNAVVIGNAFVGGRRSFMCQNGFENNFVYQNRSIGVSRCGNALESYMSEYGTTVWYGTPDEIGDDYITVSEPINDKIPGPKTYNEFNKHYPLYACIIDGRGFGQYRAVKEYRDCKFYFTKPFEVTPDETTVFTVCCSTRHNIWLNNNTELSNGHSQFIWNCGVENVVVGHEINMAAGIQFHTNYGSENKQLCFGIFNRIEHCQVRSSGKGVFIRSESWWGEITDDFFMRTHGIFGNVIRYNAFDGSEGLHYLKNQGRWYESPYDAGLAVAGGYNMIERNRITGYHTGIEFTNDCEGNYCANNVYTGTPKRFSGSNKEIGPDKE